MRTKIEISYKTIVFTVIFLLFLWLLNQVREIIFWIFIGFILMTAFKPWADYFEKWRIPRPLSVLVIYILFLGIIAYIATAVLPPLITQSAHLIQSLPAYIKSVLPFIQIDVQTLTQQIAPLGENIFKVTIGVFSNIIALFTIFMISFYMIIERKYLESHLADFLGAEGARQIVIIIKKIEEKLGAWVRGQLLLAFAIGLFTFIGLTILGIPFTLPLSILAGILEIVPFIGPIISAIPAILVALTFSPLLALTTAAAYFVIQQLEAHIVVPLVMKKAVGIPPLMTIISLMIGAKLAGISGALLAIPVVLVIETIIVEYTRLKKVGE